MAANSFGSKSPDVAPIKVVTAAVVGNALEFFDFIAYSFFAVYIGKAFFPGSTPLVSLLLSLAVSFGYAIGVAVFGGTTQLAVTWLIDVTGNPASPGWYVLVTSVIAVAAMLALPEERRERWGKQNNAAR